MKTAQDYENAEDKGAFIKAAIEDYKSSEMYRSAEIAQVYYNRKNSEIASRTTFLERNGVLNSQVKFFKHKSGFFQKSCKQLSQYLLGNGVTVNENARQKLGERFDKDLQAAGLRALIDGVAWCFWNLDRMIVFRATEFVPLFDEETGRLTVGIRFWQIDTKKPLYIELYEADGVTRYRAEEESLVEIKAKTAYKVTVRKDLISEEVINTENYPTVPIFPFYANENHESELTDGLKEDIDAYDFIASDFTDTILQIEGVYWVVKNYGGSELTQLLEELQQYKISRSDGKDSGAESANIEVPHNAKKIALELLESRMYQDTQTLNIRELTGGTLTATAIKTAMMNIDLKTDMFEYQALDVVQSILALKGIHGITIKFKRRTFTNDAEMVKTISTMLSDGYVDKYWAITNNPLISDEERPGLIDRLLKMEREGTEDAGLEAGNG